MRSNLLTSTIVKRVKESIPHSEYLVGDNRKLRPMVTISFDDGYKSDYTIVFPIFKELGLRGTFFPLPVPGGVTNADMLEMAKAGQEIATHGDAHIPYNVQTDRKTIYQDMLTGKQRIENAIGKEVLTIAYPYGGGDNATGVGTLEQARRTQSVASGIFEAGRGTQAHTTKYPYGGADQWHKEQRETFLVPYGTPDLFNVPCHLADGNPEWVYLLIDHLLALEEPAWYNVAFHRIYADGDSTKPANRLYESQFREVMEYIALRNEQKLLDVVPFYEGARRISSGRSQILF